MSARIINLRTRRKQKARAAQKTDADARATAHGQSRAKRELREAERRLMDDRLDAHKLDEKQEPEE